MRVRDLSDEEDLTRRIVVESGRARLDEKGVRFLRLVSPLFFFFFGTVLSLFLFSGRVVGEEMTPRELDKALKNSATAEERLEILGRIESVTDRKMVETMLATLEQTEWRIEIAWKRLGELEQLLGPLRKDLLSDEEWEEKDRLQSERVLAGKVLGIESTIAERIVQILGTTDSEKAIDALKRRGLRIRSELVRVRVIETLAAIGREDCVDTMLDGLRDKAIVVRVRTADLLGDLRIEKAVGELVRIAYKDKAWQARSASIQALAKIGDRNAIEPLIRLVGNTEGKVLDDVLAALEEMTGKNFGDNHLAWRDWYKQNVDPEAGTLLDIVRPLPPQVTRGRVTYQGVATHSLRVLFIFDISDSMNDPAADEDFKRDSTPDRKAGRRSKLDVAREDLIAAIQALDAKSRFSVILYNHEVKPWKRKMMTASNSNKNQALNFVLNSPATGGTNVFDSLELAFNLAGIGARDKNYKSSVDTIFLLSDGAPSAGRITDSNEILEEVDRMNRLRKIRIHTIGLGALNDGAFLRALAKRNGGKYIEKR